MEGAAAGNHTEGAGVNAGHRTCMATYPMRRAWRMQSTTGCTDAMVTSFLAHSTWRPTAGTVAFALSQPSKSAPTSSAKLLGVSRTRSESFHAIHKVPVGDSPYVRAKNVQLVDKDPERAIPLFWAAINAGDRVNSALKDMAIVMKQQNRAEEAIEAIKSLRSRCSDQAQESLDNILLDIYQHKLYLIQQGLAFNGKRTKTARSQEKKLQVFVEQEAIHLLVESQRLKKLRGVKSAVVDGPRGVESHLKAYERSQQMFKYLESEMLNKEVDRVEQSQLVDTFLGSSSIYSLSLAGIPSVCLQQKQKSAKTVAFNIDAPPFYSSKFVKEPVVGNQMHETLKRIRSGNSANYQKTLPSYEEKGDKLADLLPYSKDFEEAIIAAVLEPGKGTETTKMFPKKTDERLKVFQDITLSLSPRA
ncbi:Protein POLLENLESS 3-LIKE 2 [Hibiscus syriacus]|uniref:Protein POLLENLESS 3-LIKE 2 n=1 Tax=Hibiscus syriacus TaxID=106335 RepID=A0A6A3BIS5_HIBSY|nr:Protein POLLENLESS 3-LIKE 2 [Hibiscus syriacus]